MKRIFSLILTIAFLCSIAAFATDLQEGMEFGADDLYLTENPLSVTPVTLEATIKLPSSYTSRAGAVMGNYVAYSLPSFNLEIYNKGVPRFFSRGANDELLDLQFKDVNVCTGDWVHLAIVTDKISKKAYCYINGVLRQIVTGVAYPTPVITDAKFAVGGDQRGDNAQYFKGAIKSIRLYSDIRTADEIAADYSASVLDRDNLIAAYDVKPDKDGLRPTKLTDISGNGNHVYHSTHDFSSNEDSAYSMAFIGDTSMLSETYPKQYNMMYDWIIENAEKQNISFLFGLGDITADGYAQYALADANFLKLNERVPFSFVRGDKDSVDKFNEVFPLTRYDDQISGSFDNTMLNTFRKFEAGRLKYLALSIDVAASDEVISWANEVCKSNSDRNIIVSTHAYLDSDGNTVSDASLGENVGTSLWDKLIKLHKNITMVVCGHENTSGVVVSQKKGVNNNNITQILVNQTDSRYSGAGMVAMLYFSGDGSEAQLKYYSTVKDIYYQTVNMEFFTVETVKEKPDMNAEFYYTVNADDGAAPDSGSLSISVELAEEKGKVFVAVYNREGKLTGVEEYAAKNSLTIPLNNVLSGDMVKVMWWSSETELNPYSEDKWVRTYIAG